MRLEFSLRGLPGQVNVEVVRSTDNSSGGKGSVDSSLSQPEIDRIMQQPPDEQEATATKALRTVRAVAGFSWGFALREGRATIDPAAVLGHDAWNAHLPLLRATYPDWSFAPDFHD